MLCDALPTVCAMLTVYSELVHCSDFHVLAESQFKKVKFTGQPSEFIGLLIRIYSTPHQNVLVSLDEAGIVSVYPRFHDDTVL